MRRKSWAIVVILLLGILAAGYFFLQRVANPPLAPEEIAFPSPVPTTRPAPAPVAAPLPVEPMIAHPLDLAPDVDQTPKLDQSDSAILKALIQVLGKNWKDLLVPEALIGNIVVTVDNLPRSDLPARFVPLKRAKGVFVVAGVAADLTISPHNQERYTPYVKLIEAVNTANLVSLYRQLYPLFQEAYARIGYPKAYFNDRLIEAIDDLLAAPDLEGDIRLVQPKILYQFANPEIQALSSGQKIMIRVGRDNATRLKTKLREIRKLVAKAG